MTDAREIVGQVDVVVVGAGLSGLIAARAMRRAGLDVLVLEAADHCGGRALGETTELGSRVDLGGQWIGHDHHRLAALVDELGATRYRMHTGSMPTVVDGARRVRLLAPSIGVAGGALTLLTVVRKARPGRRWTASIADWLAHVPGRARRLLEVAAAVSWTADPQRVSVATMMSLIHSQGGLVHMLSTKGGAQDSLVVEGVGSLIDRLAADLGAAVRTGSRVREIVRDDDGALVRTSRGDVRARKVVITAPPPMAARIAHQPPLPESRAELERSTFMGTVYKAIAVYPEPFWRPMSAELVLLDRPGCGTFDTSPPGGPGHLCLLIGGPDAAALDRLDAAERRTVLLTRIAPNLGPAVLDPVGWHEKAWHLDEDAGGGYCALPELGAQAPGVPMAAEPVGCLHWAGAETAQDHPGYLDGAIEAGGRAAREVVEALAAAR